MSKMPAKKKSCFQITSVTQAQVAAIGATDDTESLEDPDESRTEDVSSEIYDVSRAEYEPACDGSSSEDGLNNVGESEVSGANAAADFRKGSGGPAQQQQNTSISASVSVNASQPPPPAAAPSPASSTVSCTSRFRVIKLDHGTGEPFRRGRWTCTEFYEKDSDRTVDSIRHPTTAAPPEPVADRDSGIGLTGGSAATSTTHSGQGLAPMADVSGSLPRMHSVESLPPQQVHNQSYGGRPQAAAHSSFSNMKPSPGPAQGLAVLGQNGLSHVQKPPIMPPVSYSPQQQQHHPPPQQHQVGPLGHHLSSPSSGVMQTEFYQQPKTGLVAPGLVAPGLVAPGLVAPGPALPPSGPPPASVLPSSTGGASVPVETSEAAQLVPPPLTVGMGDLGGSNLIGGLVGQFAAAGLRNVPAFPVSPSVPPTTVPPIVPSASSASVPNATAPSLPPFSTRMTPLGVQSLHMAGFGLMDSSGVKRLEGLHSSQSPVGFSGKDGVRPPLMPESLQLTTPTVNSLFGIHIPVDGEEDRNPSKAFYQAFQSDSRLRDTRAHCDSASGTNVVAIDNKIEQAMDLVKSHLMYAVREEVEVLKEQIKELFERNSVLERENAVLKSLANSEQLSQLPAQLPGATPPQQGHSQPQTPPLLQQQQQQQQQQQVQQQQVQQQQVQQQQVQQQQQPPKATLDPGQQQQQQPNVTSA